MSLEFEPLSLRAKRVDLSVKELAAKIEFNPESDPYTLASATAKLYDCDYVSSMCETILANKVEKFWPQGGGASKDLSELYSYLCFSSEHCWIHFLKGEVKEPLKYRCYVCCNMMYAGKILAYILSNYKKAVYFKIVTQRFAALRNDTIVSWHENEEDAIYWAQLAVKHPDWLEGIAPPLGLRIMGNESVCYDNEVLGSTSTMELVKRAERYNIDKILHSKK